MRTDRMLMGEAISSAELNDLLIQIGRSLLQYASECWPWVDPAHEETHKLLDQLAAQQQADASELVRILLDRGETIDFGSYPTDYTRLHYVAVSFLMDTLIQNQNDIARECDALTRRLDSESDAATILPQVAARERRILTDLQSLGATR